MLAKRNTELFLRILIPLILLITTVCWQPFYLLDALLCDRLYARMDGVLPQIKLIGVDEETLAEYGNFEQWSRKRTAELLHVLYESEAEAPAMVALDFLFTEENDSAEDKKLADACREKQIIVASNLVYRGTVRQKTDGTVYYDAENVDFVEQPYGDLLAVVRDGYVNAYIAKDGCIRYTKLQEEAEREAVSSFSWETYETYQELSGKKPVYPGTDANGLVQFFYSGKAGEYPHFSMRDVIEGKIPASEFKDSIVIVGAYAPGFQDAYVPAAQRGRLMYGVEIQANIIQALLEGKTAVPLEREIYLVAAGIAAALFFAASRRQNLFWVTMEGCLLMLAHGFIGIILAERGLTIPQFYFQVLIAAGILYMLAEKYVLERFHKKRLLASFRTYVEPQVVERLAKDETFQARLDGEKREVAVLFVDIRGFTPLSEALPPEQVVEILNEYLGRMTTCILEQGGMLDKFIGDAAMAVFNAPTDLEDYSYRAAMAALAMKNGAAELEEELFHRTGKRIGFGIGIHSGSAIVGNIGCDFRMDYTAIGDTVNTAARLESKAGANEILVSETFYRQVSDKVEAEMVGELALKGKSKAVVVYRILGKKGKQR